MPQASAPWPTLIQGSRATPWSLPKTSSHFLRLFRPMVMPPTWLVSGISQKTPINPMPVRATHGRASAALISSTDSLTDSRIFISPTDWFATTLRWRSTPTPTAITSLTTLPMKQSPWFARAKLRRRTNPSSSTSPTVPSMLRCTRRPPTSLRKRATTTQVGMNFVYAGSRAKRNSTSSAMTLCLRREILN